MMNRLRFVISQTGGQLNIDEARRKRSAGIRQINPDHNPRFYALRLLSLASQFLAESADDKLVDGSISDSPKNHNERNNMTDKAKVTKEASIYPKKVWVVYAACQAVALVAGFTMDMESQGASDLVAVVTVPAIICVLVALLCAPVRIVQSFTKKDQDYLKAGLLYGLLVVVHIATTVLGVIILEA